MTWRGAVILVCQTTSFNFVQILLLQGHTDRAPRKKYFDQASAKQGEREHYELLKAKGFNVKGGH